VRLVASLRGDEEILSQATAALGLQWEKSTHGQQNEQSGIASSAAPISLLSKPNITQE
jgi:hypothetical protein